MSGRWSKTSDGRGLVVQTLSIGSLPSGFSSFKEVCNDE
jgi:hypothetical protein